MKDVTSSPRKRKKKWVLGAGLLFLAVSIANVVFFFSSDKRDFYYPASYKTLYVPTDVPVLAGTRIVAGAVLSSKCWGPRPSPVGHHRRHRRVLLQRRPLPHRQAQRVQAHL